MIVLRLACKEFFSPMSWRRLGLGGFGEGRVVGRCHICIFRQAGTDVWEKKEEGDEEREREANEWWRRAKRRTKLRVVW